MFAKRKAAKAAAAQKIANDKFAEQFVKRSFQMDPATEDLLSSGEKLQEGMVVLLEDALFRADLDRIFSSEYAMESALTNNRWATVTELRYESMFEHDDYGHRDFIGTLVKFTAVYEDGTKRTRSYNVSYTWFVKLDSLPKAPDVEPESATEDEDLIAAENWN